MTDPLDKIDATLTGLAEELANVRTDLQRVTDRQDRVVTTGVLAIVLGIVAAAVIGLLVADNQNDIEANNALLCPVIRILAASDPPRSTPAGVVQQARIEAETRRPGYPCR